MSGIFSFETINHDIDLQTVSQKLSEFTSDVNSVDEEMIKDFENNLVDVRDKRYSSDLVLKTPTVENDLKPWIQKQLLGEIKKQKSNLINKMASEFSHNSTKENVNFLDNNYKMYTLINYQELLKFVNQKLKENDIKCFIPLFNRTVFDFSTPNSLSKIIENLIERYSNQKQVLNSNEHLRQDFINLPTLYNEWLNIDLAKLQRKDDDK